MDFFPAICYSDFVSPRRCGASFFGRWANLRYRDAFSSFHPLVNFLYFGLVLVLSMFLMHPVCLLISLFGSLAYAIFLKGRRAVRFSLLFLLPLLLFTAAINLAFNHEGSTILAWLPSGNPLTLESALYGLAAAAMLVSVLLWFTCYTAVMTSDKFIYLFGRLIPSLSLLLSMTLRFIPKFRAQFHLVSQARHGIGRSRAGTAPWTRIRNSVTVFSTMITWSLENAIETADSMRSRGYGLPGRTAFSIYRFDSRDRAALLWLLFCLVYLLSGALAGGFYWRWFPTVRGVTPAPFPLSFQLIYLALCLTPIAIDRKEERLWIRLRSGI